ncbi:MAG: penicillin-binding protein 1C [Saprospirales bacterium]|nr:MAG: penicillin-binding protein 1C [Saprospirales bacterium]
MLALAATLIWWLFFLLPRPLFHNPYSFVLEDQDGGLLGAVIADDEQWRFPSPDSLPATYINALLTFEDKRFYSHPGVDPLAILRAARQNISSGRIVSGGSTISMQLARMIRGSEKRGFGDKFIELLMALRLELKFSKEEILLLYASHAPFGGNVVGLEAAAWRYFGKSPENLSWSGAATLAVLPNSPALIHPGRNRDLLAAKRNQLLKRLHQKGHFDQLTLELYLEEPLPERPFPLPALSPQLLQFAKSNHPTQFRIRSSIDRDLQLMVNDKVRTYARELSSNHIEHAAVLVLDLKRNTVLSYTANVPGARPGGSGNQVDLIQSKRSTGSILKPFLYAAMLTEGEILPQTLVADIPTRYGSFSPQNFDKTFKGAVPADEALSRSLNIPAVRMLQEFGLEKMYRYLKAMGMSTLDQPSNHYGLSLMLGGAEGKLWELASMYAALGKILHEFGPHSSRYPAAPFQLADYMLEEESREKGIYTEESLLSAAAIWYTLEAMTRVERPFSETGWQSLTTTRKIAWKTGTSYGYRDAWAIGLDANYVVAVWVGNADGVGRPGLTGIEAAAPLMFQVFGGLPASGEWFHPPFDDFTELAVCRKSGYKAGSHCNEFDTTMVPLKGHLSPSCPYHQLVHVNNLSTHRVNASCVSIQDIHVEKWFVLPPSMAWYYSRNNPVYRNLPPWKSGCNPGESETAAIELIYPNYQPRLFIPIELGGERESVVFEAAHQVSGSALHWHLNNHYLGTTRNFHQMALQAGKGKHRLTLIDDWGNRLSQQFEVVESIFQ